MPARRVDRLRYGLYVVLLAAGLSNGCASAPAVPDAAPDVALEARAATVTMPRRPVHVIFEWEMTDRDARFSGRGVLRLDAGYRARVDLFGARGETLAAAILEDGDMRVVPAAAAGLLPPPALMWAALGVFRVPDDARLTGTSSAGTWQLDYAGPGGNWKFQLADSVLQHVEWTEGAGRRTVTLTGAAGSGLPQKAGFRDWTEFRQLTLSVTSVEEKIGFEPDVWILPGAR